jgi:hypothetical protein
LLHICNVQKCPCEIKIFFLFLPGYAVSLVKLPPMVGMLGLGILIRNVPYIDIGKDLDPLVAAPIR